MQVRVTTVLLLLAALPAVLSLPYEDWRGIDLVKQSLPVKIGEEIQLVDTQSVGTFSGCYSDTYARILQNIRPTIESDMNINADCVMSCKEKGYTVASTKGRNCYCTNLLPLPQLYRANDSRASGKSGPCRMSCPGAWTGVNCEMDECCGGENVYSVFIISGSQDITIQREVADLQVEAEFETPERFHVADIQSIGNFDGCYSDEESNVLGGATGLVFEWNDNYNAKCRLMCQQEGFAIAATKGSYCYCTYTLPLPQLYRADSKYSAGNGGPCSTVCPGVYATSSCRGDECCGGTNAASVYFVGQIDALKQLERRIIARVLESPTARNLVLSGQALELNSSPVYRSDRWDDISITDYYTCRYWSSHTYSLPLSLSGCSGSYGVERIRITFNYNTGAVPESETGLEYRIGVSPPCCEPHEEIHVPIFQKSGSGITKGVIDVSFPARLYLPNGIAGAYFVITGENVQCINFPSNALLEVWLGCGFGISVTAMGLTATKSGVGDIKVYNLTYSASRQETLAEIPLSKSPLMGNDKTNLRVVAMENLLESELGSMDEPFTNWDIACDNTFGSADFTCSKEYTETVSVEESWNIEHGFDISVTVGAEFEAGALFAKATTTFEVTAGYSFTSGQSRTESQEKSETFGIEVGIPQGTKLEVRFFQADIPVQVKWRASIFADGYVLVMLHGDGKPLLEKPTKLHLSQLLTHSERTLFAFGTIDYGKRSTIIARTKVVDRNGNVLSTDEEEKSVGTADSN